MSTKVLLLRESEERAGDLVDEALKSGGVSVRNVWSTSDALIALSEDEPSIEIVLIETTNHPELLEFIRMVRKGIKQSDVPIILFRLAPSLLPRDMAIYDFLKKNQRILNISNCLTISDVGVDELLRAVQFSVMSSSRLTRS
ncbi:MAG: hypothetical protein K8F91_02925 [Candidatus Obscuribacterales bacterium]|nr:hypothetical protein [Candidatus Obscuribacterales bacterium]